METFDQQGGLNDKLGRHKASEIPAGLSWEQMGPKIRAELKPKKRRRLLFWWWIPIGLSAMLAIGYFSLFGGTTELGYFPVPGQSVGENSAIAETVTDITEKMSVAKETGTISSTDDPKVKGGINVPVASPDPTAIKASVPTKSQAALTPSGLSNEVEDGKAVSASETLNNLIKLNLLNQIEALSPQAVVSLNSTAPYPEVPEMPVVSSPWIVEGGMGFAFNLNPDVYGTKLPNTIIDPLTGLAASLRIGYAFPKRPYTLWAGIEMEELVQRERLQEVSSIQVFQPNTVDTIFRNTISGEVFTTTTDSVPGIRRVNIQQHSTFRSWSVPVLLGRTWSAGGWQLEGKAGVDFNLSSWRSGGYLTEGFELENAGTQYQVGWAVRLEGQLLLPPVRFGRLFVRGGYRRSLNQQEGLVHGGLFRPETMGLTMGWRVKW